MVYKALLLQSWYGLGDPALEKQLARDLLFRRFVDLSLSERVPDHSTFWRFRNLLEEKALNELLLEEINLQLGDKGLLIRSGEISIIDASVIKAKNNRPHKGKDGENTFLAPILFDSLGCHFISFLSSSFDTLAD